MKIIFAGDCEKHDFVLTVAVLLKAYLNKPVTILPDNQRNYSYFSGEISGVEICICNDEVQDLENMIYDIQSLYIEPKDPKKVIYVTNYEKRSVDALMEMVNIKKPDGIVVIESECSLNLKYIESILPDRIPLYNYFDNPRRRIDWVWNERIDLRKQDSDFVSAIRFFLSEICNIPSKDIKKLWSYVIKRGE
jgi:hypothetical protein